MWIWQKAQRPSYIENGFRKFLTRPQPPKKSGHNIPKKGTISFDFETTLAWYIIVVSRFAQIILFPHPHTRKWKMDATW